MAPGTGNKRMKHIKKMALARKEKSRIRREEAILEAAQAQDAAPASSVDVVEKRMCLSMDEGKFSDGYQGLLSPSQGEDKDATAEEEGALYEELVHTTLQTGVREALVNPFQMVMEKAKDPTVFDKKKFPFQRGPELSERHLRRLEEEKMAIVDAARSTQPM